LTCGVIDFGIGQTAQPECSLGQGNATATAPGCSSLKVNGPALDVPDDRVDVVISFLSFRT
jgi:hypothetical protein